MFKGLNIMFYKVIYLELLQITTEVLHDYYDLEVAGAQCYKLYALL